jgi:hypothetical protein
MAQDFEDSELEKIVAEYKERPGFPYDDAWPPQRSKRVVLDGQTYAALAEELLLRRQAMRHVRSESERMADVYHSTGNYTMARGVAKVFEIIHEACLPLSREGYDP